MAEKPLDRLNYYNGQRLEAPDLKLEQDYHIRVRRLLNKSLYTPGIARGLEVSVQAGGPPTVIVGPGLALDAEGREIVLLEETPFPIDDATGSATEGQVQGNYLVIEYAEESVSRQQDGCAVKPAAAGKSGNRHAWGGPAVIRGQAKLSMSDVLPFENSGQVALGQIELDAGCNVVRVVHVGMRRYVGAASAAKVRQYALEGARDIDAGNSARVYFHIRGRQPNGVTLYLRSEKFATLYYTEMGRHTHGLDVGKNVKTSAAVYDTDPDKYQHSHPVGSMSADGEWAHTHSTLEVCFAGANSTDTEGRLRVESTWVPGDTPVYADILDVLSAPNGRVVGWDVTNKVFGAPFTAQISGASSHTHTLKGSTGSVRLTDDHTHTVDPSVSMAWAGLSEGVPASCFSRAGEPLSFVRDLQVSIGKVNNGTGTPEEPPHNYTGDIIALLNRLRANGRDWDKLGTGTGGDEDALAKSGTGEIKLDFLMAFEPGDYYLQLSVTSGGGRVLYNLYIE